MFSWDVLVFLWILLGATCFGFGLAFGTDIYNRIFKKGG